MITATTMTIIITITMIITMIITTITIRIMSMNIGISLPTVRCFGIATTITTTNAVVITSIHTITTIIMTMVTTMTMITAMITALAPGCCGSNRISWRATTPMPPPTAICSLLPASSC